MANDISITKHRLIFTTAETVQSLLGLVPTWEAFRDEVRNSPENYLYMMKSVKKNRLNSEQKQTIDACTEQKGFNRTSISSYSFVAS